MLMVESKNMAVLDGIAARTQAIAAKVIGSEAEQKKGSIARNEIREILGTKLARELILK
jgi:hypothetical protein